ncbi:MAG: hypothetical protein U0Q15_10430 [Kineosporiaceae bacterium]
MSAAPSLPTPSLPAPTLATLSGPAPRPALDPEDRPVPLLGTGWTAAALAVAVAVAVLLAWGMAGRLPHRTSLPGSTVASVAAGPTTGVAVALPAGGDGVRAGMSAAVRLAGVWLPGRVAGTDARTALVTLDDPVPATLLPAGTEVAVSVDLGDASPQSLLLGRS